MTEDKKDFVVKDRRIFAEVIGCSISDVCCASKGIFWIKFIILPMFCPGIVYIYLINIW